MQACCVRHAMRPTVLNLHAAPTLSHCYSLLTQGHTLLPWLEHPDRAWELGLYTQHAAAGTAGGASIATGEAGCYSPRGPSAAIIISWIMQSLSALRGGGSCRDLGRCLLRCA